ncbi:MAG: DUF971 domain-containing protein [Alphaproteobacteria bacterium]|nr:DUF971 domain-containing protein [Alphaproteobacteria bacterium]MBF0128371.1 DUF971 domain-containing protein [Alphaproteobacteria bacterium]
MSGLEFGTKHWPLEIRVNKADKTMEIDFDDGKTFRIPAELLRVESPSADVQGHSPDEKQIVPGKRNVGIIGVESVGNYAISINFDDTHDTGIYSWDFLYQMGENKDRLWSEYLNSLEKLGLTRDTVIGPPTKSSGGCGGGGGGGSCGCH